MKNKFRSKLFGFFNLINPVVFKGLLYVFKKINEFKNKPRILIFTDSRGFEVTKPWNRKNPYSSYIGSLLTRFSCTVSICEHKHTSILDFIEYYDKIKNKEFDLVVLHCGIVDFAPRPESSFDEMYESKRNIINKLHLDDYIKKKNRKAGVKYNGEDTYSFLSAESLQSIVFSRLSKIENLVYIGINPILLDWDGNYWRKRPSNINDQLVLDELVCKQLKLKLCLSQLTRSEIIKYTSDNVHYTKVGFNFISQKLEQFLPEV